MHPLGLSPHPRDMNELVRRLRSCLRRSKSREFDGAALRRARLRRGVELDQISDVTKVRVKFLKCIEEEAFDKLPDSVYIRGFVHAYARAIGLDAQRVASGYMVRVEAARSGPIHPLRSATL